MNREKSKTQRNEKSAAGSARARELFVLSDLRSIPAAELRPMCGGMSQWISALLRYKLLRSKWAPAHAVELRRMARVDTDHVPKRIGKPFDAIQQRLRKLGFAVSYYATIPALGPYSSAIMGMSQEDGEIHFCAYQVARKTAGGVADEGHFGFFTWLRDQRCLATLSAVNVPRLSPQIDLLIDRSDDPATVLKSHRNRLLKVNPQAVSAAELFEKVESDYRCQIDDLQRRRVIRGASPAEVARIRNEMRV
jgi:hypothetical protein